MPEPEVEQRDRLYPLSEFYERDGRTAPPVQIVTPDAIPEPYRTLLVHNADMTPTLEGHYGATIRIELLNQVRSRDVYSREVLLRLEGSHRPVQYGGSRTRLDRFPPDAAALVLQGKIPLGTLMRTWAIRHVCRPYRFLKLEADERITELLCLEHRLSLYGRQNRITDQLGRLLIDVIEVLSPC